MEYNLDGKVFRSISNTGRSLLLAVTLGVALAGAQAADGQIAGRLTDPRGAVLPGVRVTITSGAESKEVVTDRDGRFAVRPLAMGKHRVVAQLHGFTPASGDVELEPTSPRAHLAWTLDPGCLVDESRVIYTPRQAARLVDAILHVRVTSVDGPVRMSVRPECPGRRLWDYSIEVLGTAPVRGETRPAREQLFTRVTEGAPLQVGQEYLALVWPDGHASPELVLPIVGGVVMPPKVTELSGVRVAGALKLLAAWSQEPLRRFNP